MGKPGVEKVFYYTFKKDGKSHEEKAGRQYADKMTAAKASRIRSDRIEGRRKSPKELREEAKAKDKRWTINRLWESYKADLEATPGKSAKGISVDANRYEKYIKPAMGNKEPKNLVALDVERLKRSLYKTKATQPGKGEPTKTKNLSPATVKHILTLLTRIINHGQRQGLCEPLAFAIKMPKVNNIVTEDLTDDQLQSLIAAIEKDDNADARGIMLMALYTGMRRGELFKLQWKHIDFDRGFIRIVDPKGGVDQTIPLNSAARQVLEDHPRTSKYVFPGKGGGQRKTIQQALRRIRKAAGLPKEFRPLHGLRHAFASRLASSGQVDMYTLQKLLTHKSPVMTQRYAHLRDEALKRASELSGDLIDEVISRREAEEKQDTGSSK